MSRSKKKPDLFKKVLIKALLAYIHEQIPHAPVPAGAKGRP